MPLLLARESMEFPLGSKYKYVPLHIEDEDVMGTSAGEGAPLRGTRQLRLDCMCKNHCRIQFTRHY